MVHDPLGGVQLVIVPEVELTKPFSHFIQLLPQPTLLPMVFWVFAADFGSVGVNFILRHDSIVIYVSIVKVPQKLLDISMRLLLPKEFHFFTSQRAVCVMVGSVPSRPRSARSSVRPVERIPRLCDVDVATDSIASVGGWL